jgi:hypothetical protein
MLRGRSDAQAAVDRSTMMRWLAAVKLVLLQTPNHHDAFPTRIFGGNDDRNVSYDRHVSTCSTIQAAVMVRTGSNRSLMPFVEKKVLGFGWLGVHFLLERNSRDLFLLSNRRIQILYDHRVVPVREIAIAV